MLLGGRALFTISRLIRLRNERISSFFSEVMCVQRTWWDSTISSHSLRAREGEAERRWLKRDFMAAFSGEEASSGMRRTRRPGVVSLGFLFFIE